MKNSNKNSTNTKKDNKTDKLNIYSIIKDLCIRNNLYKKKQLYIINNLNKLTINKLYIKNNW